MLEGVMPNITRRRVLSMSCLAASQLAGRARGSSGPQGRPNILYIMTDDHAAQAISATAAGSTRRRTSTGWPREGMRMDRVLRDQLDLHAEPRDAS